MLEEYHTLRRLREPVIQVIQEKTVDEEGSEEEEEVKESEEKVNEETDK
jgi:hypothetical protein